MGPLSKVRSAHMLLEAAGLCERFLALLAFVGTFAKMHGLHMQLEMTRTTEFLTTLFAYVWLLLPFLNSNKLEGGHPVHKLTVTINL